VRFMIIQMFPAGPVETNAILIAHRHDSVQVMTTWIASSFGKQKEGFIVKTWSMLCHFPDRY